uniref:Transmembrane protein 214 n=1 Tax=Phlebotomus papatasi TaxID=29031 RepID=A0A1B0CZE3_PHLPP
MSLQWEVVGKSKKSQAKSKNAQLKEFHEETTKTPVVRKINDGKNNRKDNKENRKVTQESAKKTQAVKVAGNVEKEKKPVKKKFKNLEAALQEFSVDDLKFHLDVFKTNFKNSHIVWLKAILSYLNEALNVDVDAVFVCKPILYPANVIPESLKKLIHAELESAGPSNVQYFFDQSLTSLAVDLNKNLPVVGTKIILQLIALRYPVVCQSNFAKNAVLHNSYLNQSSIGLSLLWALGQGGFRDVQVGINVWQNMMVPVIEMKNYSKYVVDYIFRILQKAPENSSLKLTLQEYLNLMDTLMKPRNAIPSTYRNLLPESAFMISKLYVESTKNVSNIFLTLFKNLSSESPSVYHFTLVQCLKTEPNCVKLWELNHKKLHQQHTALLNYIRKASS